MNFCEITKNVLFAFILNVLIFCSGCVIASHIYDTMQNESNEEMRKALQISDVDWKKIQQDCNNQRALYLVPRTTYDHDEKIPKEMLEKIRALLKKYGIEPTSINIVASEEENSYAAVDSRTLFINVTNMSQLMGGQFDFAIAHEVGHLLHMHPLLDDIFSDYDVSSHENRYIYYSWQKKNELIADQYIMSKQGLHQLVKHGLDLFQDWLKRDGDREYDTHPSHKTRIESIVENLIKSNKELHYLLA